MSKRKTVPINIGRIEQLIEQFGWSNAYFGISIMSKGRGWVTEWKRGRNLPSPEEAAKMCGILQVMPADILTKPEDIALVEQLLDEQRALSQDAKKTAPTDGDGLDPVLSELLAVVDGLSDEDMAFMLDMAKSIKARRGGK